MSKTYVAFLSGKYKETVEHAKPAVGLFRHHCPGAWWELTNARHLMLWSLAYLGRIDELPRRVFPALRDATQRGDLYASTMLATGMLNLAWLARDEVDVARERVELAGEGWSQGGFHLQHYNTMLAHANLELYVDAPRYGHEGLLRFWKSLENSLLLRTEQIRLEAYDVRARAALAVASHPDGDPSVVDEAERFARKNRRSGAPWAIPMATLVLAGVANQRGKVDEAKTLLEQLDSAFEEVDLAAHADLARLRLGQLIAGTHGQELVEGATQSLIDRGISVPERWAATFAPGFDG